MILLRLYAAFFKIGLLGFGGGMAIIQLIYDSVRGFIDMSPEQFANIVAIAQVTPGPVAVNAATYVGYEAAGFWGSLLATLGVATPAFILVALVCSALQRYREHPLLQGALEGIRPATVGLVAAAVVTLGAPTLLPEHPLGAGLVGLVAASDSLAALAKAFSGTGLDVWALLLTALTVYLIGRRKANPFLTLIVMGCVGALLGI